MFGGDFKAEGSGGWADLGAVGVVGRGGGGVGEWWDDKENVGGGVDFVERRHVGEGGCDYEYLEGVHVC